MSGNLSQSPLRSRNDANTCSATTSQFSLTPQPQGVNGASYSDAGAANIPSTIARIWLYYLVPRRQGKHRCRCPIVSVKKQLQPTLSSNNSKFIFFAGTSEGTVPRLDFPGVSPANSTSSPGISRVLHPPGLHPQKGAHMVTKGVVVNSNDSRRISCHPYWRSHGDSENLSLSQREFCLVVDEEQCTTICLHLRCVSADQIRPL